MVKRINRDQRGRRVSEQVKSISENRVASIELPKKIAASQIIGPTSSTLTRIGTTQHHFSFSSIYKTICHYFSCNLLIVILEYISLCYDFFCKILCINTPSFGVLSVDS